MQVFAVLCLAALACAKPQDFYNSAPTAVTERTVTIRPDVNKYFGDYDHYYGLGFSGFSTAAPLPAIQHYSYPAQAYSAPAYPAYSSYHHAVAPVVHHAAAPVIHHTAVAPTVVPVTPTVVPVTPTVVPVAHHVAPALAHVTQYQSEAAIAPAVYQTNFQYGTTVHSDYENEYDNLYHGIVHQPQVQGETKVYKHVYAFAAPEEPAQRARVVVQAPVNTRKHYKLVFIKAPSQQTVVDSDITLPAHEEEKTLIYVLSKNQKHAQPEIRIKQAESSKHAKPDVFFLKYRNEAEAQAIASGAISGETSGVPANAELISDGSVSVLGQGSVYDNAAYKQGVSGVSQYSVGSFGVVPTVLPTVVSTPVYPTHAVSHSTVVNIAESTGAGPSRAFDAGFGRSAVQEDATVNIETKPIETTYESVTPATEA